MAQVNISVPGTAAANMLDKTNPLSVYRINGGKETSVHTEDVDLTNSDIELQLDDSGDSATKLGVNSVTKERIAKSSVELIDISSDVESEKALSQVSVTCDSSDIEVIKIVSTNAKDSYDSDVEVINMVKKEGNSGTAAIHVETDATEDTRAVSSVQESAAETVNVPNEENVEISDADKVIETTSENTSSVVTEIQSSSTETPSETVPPSAEVEATDTVEMETDVPTSEEGKSEQSNVPCAEEPLDELIQTKIVESSETVSVEINEMSVSETEIKIEQTSFELSSAEEVSIPQDTPAINSAESPTVQNMAENETVVTNAVQETNTVGEETRVAEKTAEETSTVESTADDTTPVPVVSNSTEDTQLVENSTSVNSATNTAAVMKDTPVTDDLNSDAIDENLTEAANQIQKQFLSRDDDDNESSDIDLDFSEAEVSTAVQSAVTVNSAELDARPSEEEESISMVEANDDKNVPEVSESKEDESGIDHMDTSGPMEEVETVPGTMESVSETTKSVANTVELMETDSSAVEVNETISSTVTVEQSVVEEANEVAQPSAGNVESEGNSVFIFFNIIINFILAQMISRPQLALSILMWKLMLFRSN